MNEGKVYTAGVEHEEGLEHDTTICWVCAAIAKPVKEVEDKLAKAVKEGRAEALEEAVRIAENELLDMELVCPESEITGARHIIKALKNET